MRKLNIKYVILLAGIIVFLGIISLFIKDEIKSSKYVPLPSFDRTQVSFFHWNALNEEIKFSKDQNGQWIPFPEEGSISTLLTEFASLKPKVTDKSPVESSKIQIDFGNSSFKTTLWWNGLFLTQSSDNNTFFKAEVSEVLATLLNQGRFAFYDRSFYWCPSRPLSLQLKTESLISSIEFKNSSWMIGAEKVKDPDLIENWFGKNCKIEIERFIDPKIKTSKIEEVAVIAIKFKGGEVIRLSEMENSTFSISNYGFHFVSKDLSDSIKTLKSVSK